MSSTEKLVVNLMGSYLDNHPKLLVDKYLSSQNLAIFLARRKQGLKGNN